jgi:hypothetical protein
MDHSTRHGLMTKTAYVWMNVVNGVKLMTVNALTIGVMSMNTTKKINKHICGWCITTNHDKCKKESTYHDKKYVCECFCKDEMFSDEKRERMIEEFYGR